MRSMKTIDWSLPLIIGSVETESCSQIYQVETSYAKIEFVSHQGAGYKEHNEDRIVVSLPNQFFAVIDGMGGPGGGDLASQILSGQLIEISTPSYEAIETTLKNSALQMREEGLYDYAGACYLIFWLTEEELHICYAGDVRLVIWQKEKLIFQTRDHSVVNRMIDDHEILPEESVNHYQRHLVTKAITPVEWENYESLSVPLQPGVRILTASDGLWDNFDNEEVTSKILKHPQNVVETLMHASLKKMKNVHQEPWEGKLFPKPDNISILYLDYQPHSI